MRQHHHGRLFPSVRWGVLALPDRQGEGNSPLGGDVSRSPTSSGYLGLRQCGGRRSESPRSGDSVRMDSPSGGGRSPGPLVAGGYRSFSDIPQRPSLLLLGFGLGPRSTVHWLSGFYSSPVSHSGSEFFVILLPVLTLLLPPWSLDVWSMLLPYTVLTLVRL